MLNIKFITMIIKNVILIVCISAMSQFAISQPMPGMGGSVADSLRNEGDILSAISEYKKSYFKNPKDQQNVYNLACVLSIGKQADSSFKYLNMAVEMDTSIAPLIDPDFLTIREDKNWSKFEDRLIPMLNKKFKNPYKDIDYALALWRLRALDQAYTTEIGIAGRKIGWKSSVVEALWSSKFRVGKWNQKELDDLIAKKGWPRISQVGKEAAFTAWLVIMHSSGEYIRKYLPMIKQICEEKELKWERYASIYDRSLWFEKKPQKYGTHTMYNETTNSEELYPLMDETKVDEWRKELGLEPLAEYLKKSFDIDYHGL
jgi:hypothetical protein